MKHSFRCVKWVWSPVLLAAAVVFLAGPARAADGVWTNIASDQLWSVVGNWSNNIVADGASSTANFNTLDVTNDTTVHLDTARTNGNLIFGDTATNSAAGWILDNNGNAANVLTLSGGTPTLTVNALGAGKSVTISGVIAGSSGLTKAGAGRLVVSGANTYSGATTINGGILSFGSTDNLPLASGINFNGGTLEYTGAASVGTYTVVPNMASAYINVTDTGGNMTVKRPNGNYADLVKGGVGTVTIACDANTDAGPVTVNQGTVVLSGPGSRADWYDNVQQVNNVLPGGTIKLGNSNQGQIGYMNSFTMSGGTFDVNGQNPNASQFYCVPAINGSGTITNSSTLSSGTALFQINGTPTFSGNIVDGSSKSLALNINQGTGPWTLSGTNTYSGPTTISSGTLRAGSTMAFSSNSAYSVASGKTLDLAGFNNSIGSLTGAGNVTLGAATLTVGGDNTSPSAFTGVISSSGNPTNSLVKIGSGKLTLSSTNTYTGNTRIDAGILSISNAYLCSAASVYIAAGAILDLGFTGTNTICRLYLNKTAKTVGVYDASTPPGNMYLTGTGKLLVTNAPPVNGTVISVR